MFVLPTFFPWVIMPVFLHAADLHLGMRVTRFPQELARRLREARMAGLDRLVQIARDNKVDFLLLAGDIFDDLAVDSATARRAFEVLESLLMPVFVLPGNHDPLIPGGVWDRSPWNQATGGRLKVLRENEIVEAVPGVVLLPCPVRRKTSMDDPTAWIAQAPTNGSALRIGLAHGSLKTRDDLPLDDHLMARHAATDLKLDYLALGHWHSRQTFADRDGVERTAYPGVHEPMGFPGADQRTGWVPYSGAGRAEFRDRGEGEALLVNIVQAGASPEIQPVSVGHLLWQVEQHELRPGGVDLARLIDDVATREQLGNRLLRLKLTGVLDADSMLKVDDLRQVFHRYLLGELDMAGLHVEPTEEQMRAVAGQGVLRRLVETLLHQTKEGDLAQRPVAERALVILYQLAKESNP